MKLLSLLIISAYWYCSVTCAQSFEGRPIVQPALGVPETSQFTTGQSHDDSCESTMEESNNSTIAESSSEEAGDLSIGKLDLRIYNELLATLQQQRAAIAKETNIETQIIRWLDLAEKFRKLAEEVYELATNGAFDWDRYMGEIISRGEERIFCYISSIECSENAVKLLLGQIDDQTETEKIAIYNRALSICFNAVGLANHLNLLGGIHMAMQITIPPEISSSKHTIYQRLEGKKAWLKRKEHTAECHLHGQMARIYDALSIAWREAGNSDESKAAHDLAIHIRANALQIIHEQRLNIL